MKVRCYLTLNLPHLTFIDPHTCVQSLLCWFAGPLSCCPGCSTDGFICQRLPPAELVLLPRDKDLVASLLGAEVEAQALQSQVSLLAAGPCLAFPVSTGLQLDQSHPVVAHPVGRQAPPGVQADDGARVGVPSPPLLLGMLLAAGQADAAGLLGGTDALFQPGVPYEEPLSLCYCSTIRARLSTVDVEANTSLCKYSGGGKMEPTSPFLDGHAWINCSHCFLISWNDISLKKRSMQIAMGNTRRKQQLCN